MALLVCRGLPVSAEQHASPAAAAEPCAPRVGGAATHVALDYLGILEGVRELTAPAGWNLLAVEAELAAGCQFEASANEVVVVDERGATYRPEGIGPGAAETFLRFAPVAGGSAGYKGSGIEQFRFRRDSEGAPMWFSLRVPGKYYFVYLVPTGAAPFKLRMPGALEVRLSLAAP